MIDLKNRKVLKNLIYVTTISMAVIGALFIPQIINSKIKLSKTTQEEQSIEIANNSLVSEENLNTSKKTVSRGDSDIRTATVDKKEKEVKETGKNGIVISEFITVAEPSVFGEDVTFVHECTINSKEQISCYPSKKSTCIKHGLCKDGMYYHAVMRDGQLKGGRVIEVKFK